MLGNRKEHVWFDTCRRTHSLFCTCGDFVNHLLRLHSEASREWDEWLTGGDGGDALEEAAGGERGGDGDADDHGTAGAGVAADDEDMAAVAAATEDADRSDTERSSPRSGDEY
nr:ORF2 [Epsilontorquevirus sp.]